MLPRLFVLLSFTLFLRSVALPSPISFSRSERSIRRRWENKMESPHMPVSFIYFLPTTENEVKEAQNKGVPITDSTFWICFVHKHPSVYCLYMQYEKLVLLSCLDSLTSSILIHLIFSLPALFITPFLLPSSCFSKMEKLIWYSSAKIADFCKK